MKKCFAFRKFHSNLKVLTCTHTHRTDNRETYTVEFFLKGRAVQDRQLVTEAGHIPQNLVISGEVACECEIVTRTSPLLYIYASDNGTTSGEFEKKRGTFTKRHPFTFMVNNSWSFIYNWVSI